MAKRQDLYSDSVSSVSDFILGSGKPAKPGKTRPPKFDGADYNDSLAATFAAIANAPAVFLADTAVNSLNSTLGDAALIEFRMNSDQKLVRYGLDKNAGRVRVRGSDLNKFLKSPGEYIEAAYKAGQAERKWATTIGLTGGALELANVFIWAKANGLNKEEAGALAASVWDLDRTTIGEYESSKLLVENAMLKSNSGISPTAASKLTNDLITEGLKTRSGSGTGNKMWSDRPSEVSKSIYAAGIFKTEQEFSDFVFSALSKDEAKLLSSTNPKDVKRQQELTKVVNGWVQAGWKEIATNKPKLDALVSKYITNPAERGSFYDEFGKGYKARHRSGVYILDGHMTNFGFRELMKDNILLKVNRTAGPERDKYLRTLAAVDVIQRLKPAGEYQITDFAQVKSQIEGLIPGATPAEQQQLSRMLKEVTAAQNKYVSRYRNRSRLEIEAQWRGAENGGILEYNSKFESKALLKNKIQADLMELMKSGKAANDPEVLRLQYALDAANSRFGSIYGNRMGMANAIMWYRGVKGFSPGGFVPGLFTGAAYASGPFSPGDFGPHTLLSRKRDKNGSIEWIQDKDGNRLVSKNDSTAVILLQRDYLPSTYANLTNMYYFTPGSVLKSLVWSGEGFYYMAEMRRRRMINDMLLGIQKQGIKGPTGVLGQFIDANGKINMRLVNSEYLTMLEGLKEAGYTDLYNKFNKAFSSYERNITVANFFGTPGRLWNKVVKEQFLKRVQGTFGSFAHLISKNPIWTKAVNDFTAGSIGFYQLVQRGVELVFRSVLAATGPIGTILSFIITSVVVSTLVKVSKPILDLSVFALFSILAFVLIFICMFAATPFNIMNRMKTHAIQPPVAGIELEPLPGDFPEDPDPVVLNPNQDAICPINPGAICTQGPFGAPSHTRMGTYAIDMSTGSGPFRAPTDGVVVFANNSNNCPWGNGGNYGGLLIFRSSDNIYYEVMHVNPTVGTGPVKQGTVIATMAMNLKSSKCWTGAHYHIDTCFGSQQQCVSRSRGARWLNSKEWYNELGCGIRGC